MNKRMPKALKNAKDEIFEWASELTENKFLN